VKSYDDLLFLIVDGSYLNRRAGAGLVLVAGSLKGTIVAVRTCSFLAHDAYEAEYQAIVRGRRWAPNVWTYSDNLRAIATAKQRLRNVSWLRHECRHPHHDLADRLAGEGRRSAIDFEARWRLRAGDTSVLRTRRVSQ
jgi:hypothetical protein